MDRLKQLLGIRPEPIEDKILRDQEAGGELETALAMMKAGSPTAKKIMAAVPSAGGIRPSPAVPSMPPEEMPQAYYNAPEPGLLQRLSSAIGMGGSGEQAPPTGERQYVDHVAKAIEDKNSLSSKLLNALAGGLAGGSGRGVGEIVNAQMIRENAKLREAKMMNMRDPDSQLSAQMRDIAKMYSSPEEFNITDQDSAEDLLIAMPWLDKHLNRLLAEQGLQTKEKIASMRRSGGSGLPKPPKLRPLGEKAEEEVAAQSNTIEYADYLLDKVKNNSDLVGKATSSVQKGLSKIPFVNLNDPDWIELEGQIKAFTKAYLKSMEGARPSDFDAVSYERITGNQFNSPEELSRLIANLKKSAERGRRYRLETAERNKKDVSGFRDIMDGAESSPAQKKESASSPGTQTFTSKQQIKEAKIGTEFSYGGKRYRKKSDSKLEEI